MQSKTKGKKLLNKFNDLENSLISVDKKHELDDRFFEESRISKKSNEKIAKKNEHFLKVFMRVLSKGVIALLRTAFSGMFYLLQRVVSKTRLTIARNVKETEIKWRKDLSNIEIELDLKTAIKKMAIENKENAIDKFNSDLCKLFKIKNINCSIKASGVESDKSLDFGEDINIFKFMVNKMYERNMSSNLFSVNVKSVIDNIEVRHEITFELKTKGLRWAIYCSKFVIGDLNNYLKATDGEVWGEYVSNLTQGRDHFNMTISRKNISVEIKNENIPLMAKSPAVDLEM